MHVHAPVSRSTIQLPKIFYFINKIDLYQVPFFLADNQKTVKLILAALHKAAIKKINLLKKVFFFFV